MRIVLANSWQRPRFPGDGPNAKAYGTTIVAANGPEDFVVKMTAPPVLDMFDHWVLYKLLEISVKSGGGAFRG
jgi:hypothetical protein